MFSTSLQKWRSHSKNSPWEITPAPVVLVTKAMDTAAQVSHERHVMCHKTQNLVEYSN